MPPLDPAQLTQVECTCLEGQSEQYLRFGRFASERIVDGRTRIFMFRPGAIFALAEWQSKANGPIASSIAIIQAVAPGEPLALHPLLRPGGDVLLHVETWPKVALVLEAIDAVDATGIDPCDASPDHWRHVADKLGAGLGFRPYTIDRHNAWLRRKARGA